MKTSKMKSTLGLPNSQSILIDYAHPCLMAERALKELHEAMLLKKYDVAIEQGIEAVTQVRLTLAAIRHEQEQTRQ